MPRSVLPKKVYQNLLTQAPHAAFLVMASFFQILNVVHVSLATGEPNNHGPSSIPPKPLSANFRPIENLTYYERVFEYLGPNHADLNS